MCYPPPPRGRDTWLSLSRGDTGRKKKNGGEEEVSEQVRLPEGPREGPDSDPAVSEESGCSLKAPGPELNIVQPDPVIDRIFTEGSYHRISFLCQ